MGYAEVCVGVLAFVVFLALNCASSGVAYGAVWLGVWDEVGACFAVEGGRGSLASSGVEVEALPAVALIFVGASLHDCYFGVVVASHNGFFSSAFYVCKQSPYWKS